MNGDVSTMVRDVVLEVLEDQAATVQRGDGVLRSGTKERRQALVFCADVIASRVAERLDRRGVSASDSGRGVSRERATIDLDDLERKARAAGQEGWTWLPVGPKVIENRMHIAANSPPVTLALVARIRELEQALSDALARVPADDERDRLVAVLAKGAVLS